MVVGSIASYMAKHGITDYEAGLDRFISDLNRHLQDFGHFMGLSGEDFLLEKVRLRAREFNTILNRTEEEWEIPELDAAAEAYRKASDGG